jgi:tRNA (5-methylaminomethyl-2-thiouridylate)-methyltransferase
LQLKLIKSLKNQKNKLMKIALLLSGGVDSSLALALLKEQGHDVTAFYLKIWLEDELSHLASCPWEEDLSYAQAVCTKLDVPLKIINLQKEYHDRVVTHTIAQVKAGRTPNPDVLCNEHIKFGLFFEVIEDSFEKVATGHYAQVEEKDGVFILKRSPDPIKDQTYFLCRLSQKQLSRAYFPVGHLTKEEVRALAQKHDLPTQSRKDSQGICFLGEFKFRDFIKAHLGTQEGKFIDSETNRVVGGHEGHWYYTIGQRRGIELSGGPWYVTKKDPEANAVYISNHYQEINAERLEFTVEALHWFSREHAQGPVLIKLRHRTTPKLCTLTDKGNVKLSSKDQGIASGQYAVFYDNDICLGSGIIQ